MGEFKIKQLNKTEKYTVSPPHSDKSNLASKIVFFVRKASPTSLNRRDDDYRGRIYTSFGSPKIELSLKRLYKFFVRRSPGQTDSTFPFNTIEHCWSRQVTRMPLGTLLKDFKWFWKILSDVQCFWTKFNCYKTFIQQQSWMMLTPLVRGRLYYPSRNLQRNTTQHSTTKDNTIKHNATQCNAFLCNTFD